MDDSDDEKLTLRDKIALSLLAGHISKQGIDLESAEGIINNKTINIKAAETRIRAAYKMADLVRKIRLDAFS